MTELRVSSRTGSLHVREDGAIVGARGNVRKTAMHKNGYRSVSYWDGSRTVRVPVHVLVCETWHGMRQDGEVVRHLDGNQENNAPANVKWGTPRENYDDQVRLQAMPLGEANHNSKLTADKVLQIRREIAAGTQQKVLAARYGVSGAVISAVHRRKTWAHVPGEVA